MCSIGQVAILTIYSHVTVEFHCSDWTTFAGGQISTGGGDNLDPILPCLLDRLHGGARDQVSFWISQGVVNISKDSFDVGHAGSFVFDRDDCYLCPWYGRVPDPPVRKKGYFRKSNYTFEIATKINGRRLVSSLMYEVTSPWISRCMFLEGERVRR